MNNGTPSVRSMICSIRAEGSARCPATCRMTAALCCRPRRFSISAVTCDWPSQGGTNSGRYVMDESLISGVNVAPIRMGDSTIVDQATVQGVPVQIADILEDEPARVHAAVLRAGFRAVLTLPLLGAEGIVGALVVRSRQPGEVPKATVELLQTFAAHSVLAIQNARLFEEVIRKSGELETAMCRQGKSSGSVPAH